MESEIGGKKSGGEQKITHKLGFDGEAIGMRKTKHGGGAAVAH